MLCCAAAIAFDIVTSSLHTSRVREDVGAAGPLGSVVVNVREMHASHIAIMVRPARVTRG